MKLENDAYILASRRIPFAKSWTDYANVTNPELMTAAVSALVEATGLGRQRLGDVALGSVKLSSADWNFAREVVLSSTLDPHTPAYNVARACGTSLEAAVQVALKIRAGMIDSGIAGGSDTNSDLPVTLSRSFARKLSRLSRARSFRERVSAIGAFRPGDLVPEPPGIAEPRTGLRMGDHAELMVKEWGVSRREQDELAEASHRNYHRALDEGFFADLMVAFRGVTRDTVARRDTSLEALEKLRPVFDPMASGTLTAGNSSALTDGAAAVLLSSRSYAEKRGLTPLARLVDAEFAGLDFVGGEGLLMAPTYAVARLLERQRLGLRDFDFYEIHEAFAGQVLCTLRAWESAEYCRARLGLAAPLGALDRERLNRVGSSLATGHPFAATGARILGTAAKLVASKPSSRALISICTAGGMGVAAIVESAE